MNYIFGASYRHVNPAYKQFDHRHLHNTILYRASVYRNAFQFYFEPETDAG